MRYPNVPIQQTADMPRRFGQAINHLLNFDYAGLKNAANDAAAATAGVDVGELYRNGSQICVRIA